MKKGNMKRLLEAWQEVWRTRCCPPVQALAEDTSNKGALQDHLALCPWCREAVRTGAFRAAASISEKLRTLSENASLPTPYPGMIFFMNPRLGTWGRGGRYINPPAVLVISPPENSLVTVAQVCSGSIFLGPGDIPLGNGLHGYAQAWNTYRVNPADFSMLTADTGDVSAKAVIDAMIDLSDSGRPEPGSIAWFYRHLELETGRFISQKSCRGDDSGDGLSSITREQLASDLENLGFSIPHDIPEDAEPDHLLLHSKPPESLLPLAASGGNIHEGLSLSALVFFIRNGRVKDVKNLPVTLTFSEYADGIYSIMGRIEVKDMPELERATLHWLISVETGTGSLQPIAGMSGSKGMMFWAAFNIPEADMVRPNDVNIRITAHEQPDLAGTSDTH